MNALESPAFTERRPLKVLAPEAPVRGALPRWPFAVLAFALAVWGLDRAVSADLKPLWATLSGVAGCWLARWLEERSFVRSTARSFALRLLKLGAQAFAWVPYSIVAGLANTAPVVGDVLALAIGLGGVWFSFASVGSATTLVLDRAVSVTRTRFKTRLALAIFGLLLLCLVIGVSFGGAAFLLLDQAWAGPLQGFKIDTGGEVLTGAAAAQYLREHSAWIYLAAGISVFAAGVPAMLSAASKLADAAMERLRPLSLALDAVAQGQRDVRVEEAGSLDFIEINRRFNAMVKALGDAERMEDAFGRYVSKKVLGRIRAQHGEAVIPAQLRNATVFFADVRGYTSLSEKLSPQAVVALLNRYLARVVELVELHEGYLNKFIGDAVVVVFNGPVEQPDHAERAVRCALDLQKMVAEQNSSGAFAEAGELRIGIGVATGQMVCGNVGGPSQMEYTVIGDTVNLSARLTSAAAAGEVWVSEATAQQCPGMKAEPLPEIKVKGKEKAVVPYRVTT